MVFTKALVLKVVGGIVGCAGVTYAGIEIARKLNGEITPEELIKKAGLSCGDVNSVAATGNECSILTEPAGTKLNVKQSNETTGKFEIDTITGGKIKLYKLEDDNTDYNKNLKFVIEDGDITATSNKLEQFETYEIKKEDDKYYLTRKTTSFEHKRKLLGIPNKCNVVTAETEKSCDLTTEETKALNFDGKSGDPTVTGNTTLKITKATTETDIFTEEGYKFIIDTTESITVTKSDNSSYTLKANTNPEFKIKKEGGNWTLEKAWDVSKLAAKVNLENCTTTSGQDSSNECTFKTSATINVKNGETKVDGATISGSSQKIKFTTDQENHNQGIKFHVDSDITLTGGTTDSSNQKIEGNNASYEIKEEGGKWYLSKVTPNGH